jgi:hypothetical protein
LLCRHFALIQRVANAALHVILDQGALSQVNDALDRLELLGEVHTGPPLGEHL